MKRSNLRQHLRILQKVSNIVLLSFFGNVRIKEVLIRNCTWTAKKDLILAFVLELIYVNKTFEIALKWLFVEDQKAQRAGTRKIEPMQ